MVTGCQQSYNPAALQFALGCARARDAPSNKSRVVLGTSLRILFPRHFMDSNLTIAHTHATAFPGSDAPCVLPVTGVTKKLAGNLNIRESLHVACWNVRTLLDTGSQCITVRSLFDYKVDIVCLSEVRLPDSGIRKINVSQKNTAYWIYHSGPTDNSGLHGVALAISHRANNALIAWEPISPRIAVARFRGNPVNIAVISVYAPTLAADSAAKDDFYYQLQATVDRVPKRDVLIVAGDWNARTGPSDDNTRQILGKFGLGRRCENGERLITFADSNRLVVSNTRFQHPRKHLLTWYSNDGRTANQIDYILIRSRWASAVEDCRVYRGAETGNANGSDHTLLRARLRIHLKARQKPRLVYRINTAALDTQGKAQALSNAMGDKFATLSQANDAVDAQWSAIKTIINESASEHLGKSTRRQKDWISEKTLQLSDKAKEVRLRNSPDARILRRTATRSARIERK